MTTMMKQCQQSGVDDDGNNDDGGDSNIDGNGNGDDAAGAVDSNDVNDDDDGIQGRRLDDGDRMATMGQRWCMLTMTAMTATAEMAMAMVTGMMPPLLPMATMLMTTTAVI